MKLKRGLSRIWAYLYREKLARAHMHFWRVVVQARLDRRAKNWPRRFETAVAPIYVWARTIEEAEGLAALAVEGEGLEALTCDAKKCAPAARPCASSITRSAGSRSHRVEYEDSWSTSDS